MPDPSSAIYKDAWQGVDVSDTVRTDSLAEDLVINSAQSPTNYSFAVSGTTVTAALDGGLGFSAGVASVFGIAPPVVRDASGKDVTAASGTRYTVDNGGKGFSAVLDERWLASEPPSAFPIVVDPTLEWFWYGSPECESFGVACSQEWVTSYSSTGGTFTNSSDASEIQLGTAGGSNPIWRAAVHIPYESLHSSYPGYQVYQADLAFTSPGTTNTQTICANVPTSSCALLVYDETPTQYTASASTGGPSYNNVNEGKLVAGPWNGLTLNVAPDVNGWISQGLSNQWLGISYDSHEPVAQYDVSLFIFEMFLPPQPSRATNVANGTVLSTLTPTFQAAQIPENLDDNTAYRAFDYQITTGGAPGLGQIISSGPLVECRADGVNCSNNPPGQCSAGNPCPGVPGWTVPEGELSEGVTYHLWVLTNWSPDYGQYPEVTPPADWGVAFQVKLGLGSGGPSPTDSVGAVPGQSSSPSTGAPSPGLPGSQVTVNMVNGNVSFSVGTPKLDTVGGGLSLGFTYNSLSAVAQSTPQGLHGVYYNDTNLDDVTADPGVNTSTGALLTNSADAEVGTRVDPAVDFDWGPSGGVDAQNPGEALTVWTGYLTFPLVSGSNHAWELGDFSSDGLDVWMDYNSSWQKVLSDWASHAPQASPYVSATQITPPVNSGGIPQPIPVTVVWHHSSTNPAVAALVAEDVTATNTSHEPVISQVAPSWLTHTVGTLPAGWTLNSNAAQATWVALADHGTSVTVYGADGSGYEFVNDGAGRYAAPVQDPTAKLSLDPSGDYVLDDPDSGLIYTFNPNGALSSVRSAADDLNPAALQYGYATNASTGLPELTSITDPVSQRSTTLVYGADSSPACPSPPSGYSPAPAGMLCQINLWNSTTTNLYYNSASELARVDDPGPVTYQFGYDSSGRLTTEVDPLSNQVWADNQRSDCPASASSVPACSTTITYDTQGRASTVTSPAPNAGGTVADGGQPERAYCYNYLAASITISNGTPTVNCSVPSTNVTSMAAAGMSPTVGYVEQDLYDSLGRITAVRDSAGLATTYTWNNAYQLVSTVNPDGTETSTVYNNQGQPTATYGPAPASSFHANGTPIAGQGVPSATTIYDGGIAGLAAAWYPNSTMSGTPTSHAFLSQSTNGSTTQVAASWPGQSTPYSANLNGLVTLPSPGRLSLGADGGTLSVDGHQMVDQAGGPYPGQVEADNPTDWWRLGEGSGAKVAADQTGSDPGSYSTSGVTLGQTGPLADGDSTAATFNGTSGNVTIPDSPALEMANTQAFSVEASVNTTPTSGYQILVSKMPNAAPYNGWELGLNAGKPYFQLINTYSSNMILVTATTGISASGWHLLTMAYDGSSKAAGVHLYLDSTALSTTVTYDTLTASPISNVPLTLGSRQASNYFAGSLADVSVYQGQLLSAARISAHRGAESQTSAATQSPIIYNTAYPESVEAASPVGYWRLGEASGTTTAADSWGSDTGTYGAGANGGVPGPLIGDQSTTASFNGTNSGTVTISDSTALEMSNTQPFSVEAWVKTASNSNYVTIASKIPNAAPYNGWEFGLYNGDPYFQLINNYPSNMILVKSSTLVADGRWHHVSVTYNGSSKAAGVSFYVDGQQIATTIATDALSATSISTVALTLGTRQSAADPISGNMSEVAVYRSALAASVVAGQYTAGIAGPYEQAVAADNPLSYWRLAETSGTVANDSAGSNTGTYSSAGVTLGQGAGPLTGEPFVNPAGFNGSSGDVSVADNPGLEFSQNQPFSIESWVETGNTAQEVIASKLASTSPYNGWEFGLSNGEPYFYLINNYTGNNYIDVVASQAVTSGWHQVAVTYDGSSKAAGVHFYIDGNPVAVGTVAADTLTASPTSTVPLYIGSRGASGYWFNGSLADISIYPQALAASDVAGHYQAANTTPGPGPNADVHQIALTDQQYSSGGQETISTTVSGAGFDPNYGLVTSATDADGNTTSTCYTDAAGCNYASTSFHIGPQYGVATSVTQNPGGLNLTTTTTYETPGPGSYLRVLSKTLPEGSGPSYSYYANTAGPLAAVCGVTSTTNQAGELQQETDPAPATGSGDARVQQYVYDSTGRQVGVRVGTVNTISSAGWSCTSYDASGRIISQTSPAFGNAAARTVTYTYAVGSNPLVNSVTDTNWPNSAITSTVDLTDRIVSYTDIFGNTTTTNYDQVGRLVSTSGPQGNVTYSYDPATGRATTTALGGTTLASEGYDSAGRLDQVNIAGTTTGETIGYDQNGRQSSETITTPALGTAGGGAQTYSPAGRVATQQFYANGSLSNPSSASYDAAGRLTQDVLPGVTYNYSYATSTGCVQNNAGADTNRTGLTVTVGSTNTTTSYCYDNADRLTSTSNIASGQVVYDTHGNMIQEGAETYGYNSSDQLVLDDAPAYLNVYQRDPLGRPAQISDYTKIAAGQTSTASAAASATVAVNQPSGTQAGDTELAAVTTSIQNGATTPTGWNLVTSTQNGTGATYIYDHQAQSGDPASWTFNMGSPTANVIGTITDYKNGANNPIDVYATANDSLGTTQALPGVTTNGYAETIYHVVGYNGPVTATGPTGDTQRANTTSTAVAQVVSDQYQQQPGATASASASSNVAATSEAITVALIPQNSTTRLGYSGETDQSGFTQNTNGSIVGTTIDLPGGITYNTTAQGASYSYANFHGDTIELTDSNNNRIWYGYWGPYGETPPGQTPPPDTANAGGTYGYNGAQGKLTEGNLILMGARPYSIADGRFLQVDPVSGGCANDYTYAFGDPVNHPDLSGEDYCIGTFSAEQGLSVANGLGWGSVASNLLALLSRSGAGSVVGAIASLGFSLNADYVRSRSEQAIKWAEGQRRSGNRRGRNAVGRVALFADTFQPFGFDTHIPNGGYHLVPYVANGFGAHAKNPC